MAEISQKRWDGSAWFTNFFMSIYDWFALGINCRFIWGCKSENIIELYNEHVSGNHLDIGCGTGYFLNKCSFPNNNPTITLFDLNPRSLKIAAKRLKRYRPATYAGDILQPLEIGNHTFDSIALVHLLHCLPGDMKSKEPAIQNIKKCLTTSGIIFGSTFLSKGTRYNKFTEMMFRLSNRTGFMSNKNDDLESLSGLLKRHFEDYNIRIIGCEAVFWVKNKRP
jgi:SAM-dependent methyltransferase